MKNFIFILFLISFQSIYAQSVLISPTNSSKLIETNSTNKAVQMPSVSATSAIASPQKGMVVFDDATGTLSYFNGSQWVPLSNSTTGWAVNGTNLGNTNSGKVGIGTSLPASKLHVFNGASGQSPRFNASMALEDDGTHYLQFLSPQANETGILFGLPSSVVSGGMIYNASGSKGLQFRTRNNTTRLQIDSIGVMDINAGIGINSTTQQVKIDGSGIYSDKLPSLNLVPLEIGKLTIDINRTIGYSMVTDTQGDFFDTISMTDLSNELVTIPNVFNITFTKDIFLKTQYSKIYFFNSVHSPFTNIRLIELPETANEISLNIAFDISIFAPPVGSAGKMEFTFCFYGVHK